MPFVEPTAEAFFQLFHEVLEAAESIQIARDRFFVEVVQSLVLHDLEFNRELLKIGARIEELEVLEEAGFLFGLGCMTTKIFS